MVDSQPGKVQTFDPTVSLSNFSAETRDQLIFNGNQLVLAKLQQPEATQAVARSRMAVDVITEFSNYVNSSGALVYVDGSFQALSTAGVPTSDVHQVKIGFDVQVTTDQVIFWTTTYVDAALLFVEYSFEDSTWFSVGAVTWSYVFDDTIENFPGDVPPTGQFKYTGTFDGGNVTARYWRIRSDVETSYVSGSAPTITVASTTNWPTSGYLFAGSGNETRTLSYTGKTSSTFTGVTDAFGSAINPVIYSVVDPYAGNGNFVLTVSPAGDPIQSLPPAGSAILEAASTSTGYPYNFLYPQNVVTWTGKVDGEHKLTGVSFNSIGMFDTVYLRGGGTDLFWSTLTSNLWRLQYTPFTLVFGSTLVNMSDAFANNVTEVQIIPSTAPIFQHWNSDGTQATSVLVDTTDPYTAAYDKYDNAYYVLRFNDSLVGDPVVGSDDFNGATGSSFDSDKWVESTTNVYFQHNTTSGTLDYTSAGGPGQLVTNYTVQGDFSANIETVYIKELNQGASFALEAKDASTGNVHMSSVLRGAYIPEVSTVSGTLCGATMTYTDTVGGAAFLQNFRVNPATIDYSLSSVNYSILYNATNAAYDVTISGIVHNPAFPGIPYTADSASFTVVNLTTPADGQGFSVDVFVDEISVSGTLASGVALEIERIGTNAYVRYDDAYTPGSFDTLFVGNTPTDDFKLQIYGDANGQNVHLIADNFEFTGTSVFNTPVFSVVTLDNQGDIVQVAGISDADGYAIKALDLIRDPSATVNDYLTPRVGIATNGVAAGSGGEIYIKINDALYRYLKTSLPIVANEDGSSAAVSSTGELPSTNITGFSYNGYSQGGLCYIVYDADLGGVFLRTIELTNLTATANAAELDVPSISYPFAWNITDLATLYYVDGTDLKLYDLNETKAAFVNLTSDKQVLAAGTAETATITGQVLNVYGEPKSNKTMTFTVSAGDGAISPAIGCSDVSGEDTTLYTVGSAVGTATITATVSDLTC